MGRRECVRKQPCVNYAVLLMLLRQGLSSVCQVHDLDIGRSHLSSGIRVRCPRRRCVLG